MLANLTSLDTDCERIDIFTEREDGFYADKIILNVMYRSLVEYQKVCDTFPNDFTSQENWDILVAQIIDDLDRYLFTDFYESDEAEAYDRENLRASLKLYAEYFDEFWNDR